MSDPPAMVAAVRATLGPEFRFLLAATRWPHDPGAIAEIRAAAGAVTDSGRLLALTRRHHVTGLVARALGHCRDFAGTPLHRTLALEALGLAEEQFRQLVQTRAAVGALQARDIPVAVIKGPPVALAIYGEAGVRRSVDIDLLIDRADLDRAGAVLERSGYERSEPPRDAPPRQVRASLRHGKDWGFDHFGSDTGIELHWRLFQNPRLMGDVSVRDAVERRAAPGMVLPVLPLPLAALHLVVHGAEHAWSRLKWLADLAALIRSRGDDGALLRDAAAHGLSRPVSAALMLAHALYETPLPDGLARDWRTRRLFAVACASLIGRQDGTELEDCAGGATAKNLSHYLFRADPRFWWDEMAYDLFHDAREGFARRLARRARNVLRLQRPAAAT